MGFSVDWLVRREAADRRARAIPLADLRTSRRSVPAFPGEDAPRIQEDDRPLRVVDLGAGTGSNLRWSIETGPPRQAWRLVDHDAALLAAVPDRLAVWAADRPGTRLTVSDDRIVIALAGHGTLAHRPGTVADVCLDVRDLMPFDPAFVADADVVTASALLDLVSEPWLAALVAACADVRASALFALTYDGRIACEPAHPLDARVRDLVNRHQRSDKGFGPAAGPDATTIAARLFTVAGYRVWCRASDWWLDGDPDLQHALVEGWADAAVEIAPGEAAAIEGWRTARRAAIAAGLSRIVVGHQDLAAVARPVR